MKDVYIAIPNECRDELMAWLKPQKHKLLQELGISECRVFAVQATHDIYRDFCGFANEQFWPYNVTTHFNDTSYWPSQSVWRRYDYQGGVDFKLNASPGHPEVRDVLHQLIVLKDNDPREKDRLFHSYLLNTDWENQLKYGQLARMRKLLGAD